MFVQSVLSPVDAVESWTVLGDDGAPVAPTRAVLGVLDSNRTVTGHSQGLRPRFEGLVRAGSLTSTSRTSLVGLQITTGNEQEDAERPGTTPGFVVRAPRSRPAAQRMGEDGKVCSHQPSEAPMTVVKINRLRRARRPAGRVREALRRPQALRRRCARLRGLRAAAPGRRGDLLLRDHPLVRRGQLPAPGRRSARRETPGRRSPAPRGSSSSRSSDLD